MASLLEVKDNRGSIKGELSSGDKSDDNKLTLKGEAKAGSTVQIYDNGELIGTTKANKKGEWSFNTPKLEEGSHSFKVAEEGKKGKSVRSSDNFELDIDQSISEATEIKLMDKGAELSNGMVHGNGELELSGKAEAGATVEVINNGMLIAEVVADANGDWKATLNLSDGGHSLQTRVIDEAGNSTDVSDAALKLSIDKSVANQPAANSGADEVILPPDIVPIKGDPTNVNTPLINGSATVGSTVTLSVFNGNTGETDNYGPITVDSTGTWSIQITNPLPDGTHLFRAKATNNAGDSFTAYELPIDTEMPDQPTIDYAKDNVGLYQNDLQDDDHTDDDVVELHGTAEANSLVIIYSNNAFIGVTRALDDGSWSYTPTSPMPEGDNTFIVTSTDSAGNASLPSEAFNLTLDRHADAPEVTHLEDDQGSSTGKVFSGSITDDDLPIIAGTAEANALVDVYLNGKFIDQLSADDNGNWELQLDQPLKEGKYTVAAEQIDVAGNESGQSTEFDFQVKLNAGPEAKDDSATTSVGKATTINVLKNDKDPDGDKLEVVKITKQGGYGRAEINSKGKIVYTPDNANLREPVTDTIKYRVSDGKGGSDIASIKITLYPEHNQPTIDLNKNSDRGWSDSDNITNDSTPTLQGKATPNSKVTIYQDGVNVGTTTASLNGTWKFTSTTLDDGDHDFTVTSRQLGESISSKSLTVTIDTQLDAVANFTAASYTNSGSVQITISTSERVRYSLEDDSNQLNQLNDTLDMSQTFRVEFAGTAAIANHGFEASFSDRAGNKSSNNARFDLKNPPPADPTAALKDGGYIVTFFKPSTNAEHGFDIFAQRYTENGTETGEAFIVNSYQVDDQIIPDVTGLEDGGYVVSWQSFGQDGDEYGIYAQRFDANDQAVGEEFKVSESNIANQHRAEISALNNGGFVITWVSESEDGSERVIYSRFYDSNGEAIGPELQVNNANEGKANYPTVTSLSNGNAVIVWEENTEQGVKLQSAIYSPAGDLVQLNSNFADGDNWQMQPHVDAMEDGGFVVSWLSNTEDARLQTIAQVFDADGQALSEAIVVSEDSSNIRPEVGALTDGSFIVSWLEDGELYYANYSAKGEQLSTASINPSDDNQITETHALALNNGGFLITWVELSENSPVAVFGMQFDSKGNTLGERFIVEPLSEQLVSNALMPSESLPIELNYQLGTEEENIFNDPEHVEYDFFIAENQEGLDLSDVLSGEDTATINFGTQQFSNNASAEMDWFSLEAAYNFGSAEGLFSLDDLQTAHLGI